eukprot:TRINITY_DN4459_c0_g2_i1.p1 TRINITY_DN4459_c0_g2~~TRINITY_DN4459_c0_g2_i1.p1  ORF type:complete len:193 (+),score=46.55 TRINITY_DN4459_c0_g2_i1:143-721(+)
MSAEGPKVNLSIKRTFQRGSSQIQDDRNSPLKSNARSDYGPRDYLRAEEGSNDRPKSFLELLDDFDNEEMANALVGILQKYNISNLEAREVFESGRDETMEKLEGLIHSNQLESSAITRDRSNIPQIQFIQNVSALSENKPVTPVSIPSSRREDRQNSNALLANVIPEAKPVEDHFRAVSYTHLTLPTIYSV